MKVFIPENWDELKGKLKGKVVEVRKGSTAEHCCAVIGKFLEMTVEPRNLREVLEMLADLGFDFAALIGFDLEVKGLEKGLGFKIPRVRSVEEALKAPEIESLKSLILKTKMCEGVDKCGAIGIFVGFVRKLSDGKVVKQLEYEAYEDALQQKIRKIEERVKRHKGVVNVRIYHKRGILLPSEDIVYVVVMGEHRGDVWEPLKEAVELMKKELPIWKKEVFEDGAIWVHDKTSSKF